MPPIRPHLPLVVLLALAPGPAIAQSEAQGAAADGGAAAIDEQNAQTSRSALVITAGAQLDAVLMATARRTFDNRDEAIAHTEAALESAQQLQATLQRLAGQEMAERNAAFIEAETLVEEISAALEAQEQALVTGDRRAYGMQRLRIYQRLADMPPVLFTGPEGQPDNLR